MNTKIAGTHVEPDGNRFNVRPTDEKVAGTGHSMRLDSLTSDDQGGLPPKEGTQKIPEYPAVQNNREGKQQLNHHRIRKASDRLQKRETENDQYTTENQPEAREQCEYNEPPFFGINDEILSRQRQFRLFMIDLHSSYPLSYVMLLAQHFPELLYCNILNSKKQNHDSSATHAVLVQFAGQALRQRLYGLSKR